MGDFFAFFSEHIGLALLLIAFAVLALFVLVKAGRAFSKRSAENNRIIAKLEADTKLRKEFENLTPELAGSAQPEKLFKGVALNLCRRIEKSENILEEFNSLNDCQKEIYSLYFVFEDGGEALSEFFKINGKPLTEYALSMVKKIYPAELSEIFESEYDAYDSDNETASLIADKIAKEDAQFKKLTENTDIFAPAAEYIISNINAFI